MVIRYQEFHLDGAKRDQQADELPTRKSGKGNATSSSAKKSSKIFGIFTRDRGGGVGKAEKVAAGRKGTKEICIDSSPRKSPVITRDTGNSKERNGEERINEYVITSPQGHEIWYAKKSPHHQKQNETEKASTMVLRTGLHCDGCIQETQKSSSRYKGVSIVPTMNDRGQSDEAVNVLHQVPSTQTPLLLLPAPGQGDDGSSDIVEVYGSSLMSAAANSSSQSLAHQSTPPPKDSYTKAKLILERAAKLVNFVTVYPNRSTSKVPSVLDITNEMVKAKWLEFLELSKGGFTEIVDNPAVFSKLKDLLNELCKGDIRFTRSPRFRKQCEDFLADFLIGIEIYRRNYEEIISLVNSMRTHQHSHDSIEEACRNLQINKVALQTLVDERAALDAREVDLKRQLAEVQRQQQLKDVEMTQMGKLVLKSITSFETLKNENDCLDEVMAEKRCIENQCLLENSRLDHFMSAFQEEVKNFLKDMH